MPIKNLIFDFDGVLADTNEIRLQGFLDLFRQYPAADLERFAAFVRANGGASRYVKIASFLRDIRGCVPDPVEVRRLAERYSTLVMDRVVHARAVAGSVEFLKKYRRLLQYAVVSGADENELRNVCEQRGLATYFRLILGSPADKAANVAKVLRECDWSPAETIYFGDSMNDRQAAVHNCVRFVALASGWVDWSGESGLPVVQGFNDFCEYLEQISPVNRVTHQTEV